MNTTERHDEQPDFTQLIEKLRDKQPEHLKRATPKNEPKQLELLAAPKRAGGR